MVTAGPWPRLATIPDDFPALLSETNWTMRLARIFLLCPLIDWVSVLVRCALPYRALPTVNAWALARAPLVESPADLSSAGVDHHAVDFGDCLVGAARRTGTSWSVLCIQRPLYGVQPGIW